MLLQFCTFRVDELFLGVHVEEVQEVILSQPMQRVPLAPPTVRGLVNLRGQIATAIDLRCRFGFPKLSPDCESINVLVNVEDEMMSLLVDEIGDVVEVDAEAVEEPPPNMEETRRELVHGVVKLEDCLLLVLNTRKASYGVQGVLETTG